MRSLYAPLSVAEQLREAWQRRAMLMSTAQTVGRTSWSPEAQAFIAWDEPNFFICLHALQEPGYSLAKATMEVQPDALSGQKSIVLTITPPEDLTREDNGPFALAFAFEDLTLAAQIERVMDACLLFFRTVRAGWSWYQFKAQFLVQVRDGAFGRIMEFH